MRGCVCWERKINFHFLGWNSCFFLLYTFCLALKKKPKQTRVCSTVRVNPTTHECIQIINRPGSNFPLVPERRQKPRVNAQITRDASKQDHLPLLVDKEKRRVGAQVWAQVCSRAQLKCRCVGVEKDGRHTLPVHHSHEYPWAHTDAYGIFFKLTHFLSHLAKQWDS